VRDPQRQFTQLLLLYSCLWKEKNISVEIES
jgi:hypothetical protein